MFSRIYIIKLRKEKRKNGTLLVNDIEEEEEGEEGKEGFEGGDEEQVDSDDQNTLLPPTT